MSRQTSSSRFGFTMVELLIVMAIIGVLVAITLPVLNGIRVRTKVVVAINDMSQLSNAVGQFKSTYGAKYIPNAFKFMANDPANPQSDPLFIASQAYANSVWTRFAMNPAGPIPTGVPGQQLDNNQSLMFFLGGPGAWGGAPAFGFNSSGSMPFDTTPNTQRTGPFFDFPKSKVIGNHFVDPWGTPYLYLSADGTFNSYDNSNSLVFSPTSLTHDGATLTIYAFREGNVKFVNAGGFQIISAGPNKTFGPGSPPTGPNTWEIWEAGKNKYTPDTPGGDDLSNFHPGNLGAEAK